MSRVLTALLVACAGCGSSEGEAHSSRDGIRHLIVISVDTLRADYLGCYGHPFVQSPNIDRLAREGVLFERCFSTAPTTLASHTSLFTGTYPHTHGVARNGYEVADENEMLAEVLAARGFRAAGFVGAAPLDTDVNFHQGFEHYQTSFSLVEDLREGLYQRPANEVTAAVLAWLDDREGAGSPSERLFLFAHYYDVHAPYTPPAPFARMYREDDSKLDGSLKSLRKVRRGLIKAGALAGERDDASEAGFHDRLRTDGRARLRDAKYVAAEYGAGVTWTDSQIGVLLDGLEERGILDEMLVVLTSDHGETMFEHQSVFKHGTSVYDTEIHVPLIFVLPDGRHAGTRVERITSGIDVMPTALALLGIDSPAGVEGEDVSIAFAGSPPPRAPIFAEATKPFSVERYNDDPLWPNRRKFQCVRSERYKYMICLPDDQFRLYDLHADPTEEVNLLAEENGSVRAVADELDRTLRAWSDSAKPISSRAVDSQQQRDALDALGYGGDDEE